MQKGPRTETLGGGNTADLLSFKSKNKRECKRCAKASITFTIAYTVGKPLSLGITLQHIREHTPF